MIVIPDPNLATSEQQEVYAALVAGHPEAARLGGMRLRVPDGTSHRKLTGAVQVERGVTTPIPGGRRKRKPARRHPSKDPFVAVDPPVDESQRAAEASLGYGQLEAETPTREQLAAELGVAVEDLDTDREVRDPGAAPVDLTTLPPPPDTSTTGDPEGITWDELDDALASQPALTEGTPPEADTAPTPGDTTTTPEEG